MPQKMKRSTRLGAAALMATMIALVAVAVVRFPEHLSEVDWPSHAKTHLVGQIGATVALAILGLAILAGPFQRGRRWAWLSLTFAGLAVFGAYWFAIAVIAPDQPWRGGNTTFAMLTGGYAIGLVLSWSSFFGGER